MPLNESQYFEKAPGTEKDFKQVAGEPSFAEKIQTYYEDPGKLLEDFYGLFGSSNAIAADPADAVESPPQIAPQAPQGGNMVNAMPVSNPYAQKNAGVTSPQPMAQAVGPYDRFKNVNPLATLKAVENQVVGDAEKEAMIRQNYANDVAKKNEAFQANANRIKEDYNKKFGEYTNELDKLSDDIKNTKIDPSRYWENRTGLQKALMLIGLAMTAKGTPQGTQAVMNGIQKEIDRDIDAQKYALQQKGNRRGELTNMLSIARTKFGDDLQAENATRLLMMDQVKNQMEAKLATLKTGEAKQKMGLLKAAMEEKMLQQLQAQNKKQMQQGDIASVIQSQDPFVIRVSSSNLPHQTKLKILTEYDYRKKLEDGIRQISSTFDRFKSNTYGGDLIKTAKSKIPATDENKIQKEASASLFTTVQANWKGPMSDQDSARLKSLMPDYGAFTSDADIDRRKREMINMLLRGRKEMPFIENSSQFRSIYDVANDYMGTGNKFGKKVGK